MLEAAVMPRASTFEFLEIQRGASTLSAVALFAYEDVQPIFYLTEEVQFHKGSF